MSIDPFDAAEDDYLDKLYQQFDPEWAEENWYEVFQKHYEEAAGEFAADRLISYYLKYPDVAEPALRQLWKAQSFQNVDSEACVVFSDSAIEIVLKSVLTKPLLYGLVHTETVADLVMGLVPQTRGPEQLRNIVFRLLADVGGVDLRSLKREGVKQTLWEEVIAVRTIRNGVLHRGAGGREGTSDDINHCSFSNVL